MLSTTAIAGSFTEFSARIFGIIAHTPSAPTAPDLRKAMHVAAKTVTDESRIPVAGLLETQFLSIHGEPIVADYVAGLSTRHQAAVNLAHAWESHAAPGSEPLSKQQRADAVMMADRFLSQIVA